MRPSRLTRLEVIAGLISCLPCTTHARAQNPDTKTVAPPQYLVPLQLPADRELFNPMSGLYTAVAQKQPGPRNPPCPTCALDLNFQPLAPGYNDAAPLSGTPLNEYGRMSWHSLEPLEGQYDFSIIDNVLGPCPVPEGKVLCLPQGGRFGFRIMALNPQYKSATNVTKGLDGYPIYSDVPSYLEKDDDGKTHGWLLPVDPSDPTAGHYFVPDWNDPYFLDSLGALLSALGRKYDTDPRIGWIDIGLYGSWGEWHTGGLPDTLDYKGGAIPYKSSDSYFNINTEAYQANTGSRGAYQIGTEASKNSIVSAHLAAFPDRQLVMLTDDGDAVCTALHANAKVPVGLRRDSLGAFVGWNYHFPLDPTSACTSEADQALIANRWKTAPFTVEPFGNGSSPTFPCQTFETDPATGLLAIHEQVRQFHLAAVKNGSFCVGSWEALTQSEQAAVLEAGLRSGYRYSPIAILVEGFDRTPAGSSVSVQTRWANTGVTPAYDEWSVEFSLWAIPDGSRAPGQCAARFMSRVDLRRILPTPSYLQDDIFALPPEMDAGRYELRMRVVDPQGYLKPMQLALQSGDSDGYYPLGVVQIPGHSGAR